MAKQIFINLPVSDLSRSTAIYKALGFEQDMRFSDATASGMRWSETISLMLLTHEKWKGFTDKAIVDGHKAAQVMLCISMDDRESVDAITEKAGAAGGAANTSPPQDYGFMYGRTFEDPDGHVWEPMWMDVAGFEAAQKENA